MKILNLHYQLLFVSGILSSTDKIGCKRTTFFSFARFFCCLFGLILFLYIPNIIYIVRHSDVVFEIVLAGLILGAEVVSFFTFTSVMINRQSFFRIVDRIDSLIEKSKYKIKFNQDKDAKLKQEKNAIEYFENVDAKSDLYAKRFFTVYSIGALTMVLIGTIMFSIHSWMKGVNPSEWDLPIRAE